MKPDKCYKFSFFILFICQVIQVRMVHICDYYPPLLNCRCAYGKFLPTQLKPEIESLVISDSNLDSLTPFDFSLLINLKSLSIDACNIPLIEGINLLVYLKHLSNLHIVNSNVTVKVMTLFSSGVNIRILSLPQNKLTYIPKGFFRNVPKLESIDLSCNEIEGVEIEAFKDLTHLVDINLSHNRIGQLFDPAFFSGRPCVYCASSLDETRCPERAVEKCRGNEQVDALWRKFAGRNISLEGNPLCETFSVEDGEEGQHLEFTPAPRLDPQNGVANHNKMAARKDPQDGDANHNMAARQDPQAREGTQYQSSTPTLPTESQDGDCSFHSVGRCHKQLKKRHLFLRRVCRKKNKYTVPAGAADRVLLPSEQEIPDDTGDNISSSDHGDNYTTVRVPKDESNSRDVAEHHPPQGGDRRNHGDEGKDEVGSQCQGDEQGRVDCQGKDPGEDREPVENADHEKTKEEELKTAFWRRSFKVTFLQAFILLIIVICVVVLLLALTASAWKKLRKPPTRTSGSVQTDSQETNTLLGSQQTFATTASTA